MQGYSMMKCFYAAICLTVVLATVTSAPPSYADYDNNIRDLVELLMRDNLDENRLSEIHQVVRKASRSPQLRLRFGKRPDSSLGSPLSSYMMADQENQ